MGNYSVLYRLNGGEVLKIAPEKSPGVYQMFEQRDTTIYGVVVNPTIENEVSLETLKNQKQTAYLNLKNTIDTRLEGLNALHPSLTEEAELIKLQNAASTARQEFIKQPSVITKENWAAKQTAYETYQALINNRIATDSDVLKTAQEKAALATALTEKQTAELNWKHSITCCDVENEIAGPKRILGFAKIYHQPTNTVRNATQVEIDSWQTKETEDNGKLDAEQAKRLLSNHPQFRKFAQLMFKAMNQIRQDAGLQPWTKPQIVNFIQNQVSKDD